MRRDDRQPVFVLPVTVAVLLSLASAAPGHAAPVKAPTPEGRAVAELLTELRAAVRELCGRVDRAASPVRRQDTSPTPALLARIDRPSEPVDAASAPILPQLLNLPPPTA